LASIKLKKGCADCGYKAYSIALDFDHRDTSKKRCGVSRAARNAQYRLAYAEAAKCDVVCANCHRVRTLLRKHHTLKQPPQPPPVTPMTDNLAFPFMEEASQEGAQ
jgi:hypothetical protein